MQLADGPWPGPRRFRVDLAPRESGRGCGISVLGAHPSIQGSWSGTWALGIFLTRWPLNRSCLLSPPYEATLLALPRARQSASCPEHQKDGCKLVTHQDIKCVLKRVSGGPGEGSPRQDTLPAQRQHLSPLLVPLRGPLGVPLGQLCPWAGTLMAGPHIQKGHRPEERGAWAPLVFTGVRGALL